MASNKFDEYERTRQKGVSQLKGGSSVAKVANTVGVSRQTVYNWLKRGTGDSAKIRPGGRPRKLTEKQRAKLKSAIERSPRQQGFNADNWTGERIAELIRKQFGVTFNPKSIPQMLRSWGWEWRKGSKGKAAKKAAPKKAASPKKKAVKKASKPAKKAAKPAKKAAKPAKKAAKKPAKKAAGKKRR